MDQFWRHEELRCKKNPKNNKLALILFAPIAFDPTMETIAHGRMNNNSPKSDEMMKKNTLKTVILESGSDF